MLHIKRTYLHIYIYIYIYIIETQALVSQTNSKKKKKQASECFTTVKRKREDAYARRSGPQSSTCPVGREIKRGALQLKKHMRAIVTCPLPPPLTNHLDSTGNRSIKSSPNHIHAHIKIKGWRLFSNKKRRSKKLFKVAKDRDEKGKRDSQSALTKRHRAEKEIRKRVEKPVTGEEKTGIEERRKANQAPLMN